MTDVHVGSRAPPSVNFDSPLSRLKCSGMTVRLTRRVARPPRVRQVRVARAQTTLVAAIGFAGHGGVAVLALLKRGGATASESLGTARTDLVASARPEHMRHPTSRRDS